MQRLTSLLFVSGMCTATAAISATSYPQPSPSAFSPQSGAPGTVITITGSGFTGLNAAWLGTGHDATVYVVSDSVVKVTVPADATTAHIGLLNPQKSVFMATNFTVTGGTSATPGTPSPATGAATVSGAVVGPSNASVVLAGSSTRVANANANGTYSFTGVTNGTYTVAPSTSGHVFTPISVAAQVKGASVSGLNFAGTPTTAPTYTLSGTISGSVSTNVTVTLNGTNVGSVATDQSGNYTFSGLSSGTYTVGATAAGHAFSPAKAVTLTNVDLHSQNMTSTTVTTPLSLVAVTTLPPATAGKSYSASVLSSISGGSGAYHYQTGAYQTGTPPMGMIVHSNGVLNGTPAKAGKYAFELCAADSAGGATTTCVPTSITVAASGSAPAPAPTPAPTPTPTPAPAPTPTPTPAPAPAPAPAPTPTPAPAPAPITAGTSWIYYNGVFDWPGDWPFVAATDYTDSSGDPLSGPQDLKITLQGQYGGWIPWAANFDFNSAGYTKLTMALKPTESNQGWTISFVRVGDVPVGITVNLADYGPAPVAGKWGVYTIPLSALGVLGQPIYKFVLQDSTGTTGNVWYVDNVGFVP